MSFDPPVPLSTLVQDALRDAATRRRCDPRSGSGAGHDAGILAAAGVEAGMLFVRSRNGGVSHRPEELTDEADIATAAAVLTARCGRSAVR